MNFEETDIYSFKLSLEQKALQIKVIFANSLHKFIYLNTYMQTLS